MKKEDLIDFCLEYIKKCHDSMEGLKNNWEEAIRYYNGDSSIVDAEDGTSKLTTSDLFDAIEWAKPSLLKVFTSTDEAILVQPTAEEDVSNAADMGKLINYQMKIKNNYFLVLHDWLDDAFKLKIGIIKWQWKENKETIDKEYNDLTELEVEAKKREALLNPNIEVLDEVFNMLSNTYNITIRHHILDEYPHFEAIPPEDFGINLKSRTIEDAGFCYHKIIYKKHEIKKKYGEASFNKIKDLQDKMAGNNDDSSIKNERFKDLGGVDFVYNKKDANWYVYECYYIDPESGEPYRADICGNVALLIEKNKYKRPPFRIITPIKTAHRIAGYSMFDLMKELQKTRTSLIRQIFNNIYVANNRRHFIDPSRINMDDYLNNNYPGAGIRTLKSGINVRDSVAPEEIAPIASEVFSFYEMLNIEKDYHSGVPRSFQGVNPDELNKTWRGQSQQVSQAAQRIAMMARLIAEMGLRPLVSDLVELNIRFLKKETAIRYLNKPIIINPDNIVGKFDIITNIGLGTGETDKIILYTQQLLGIYKQFYQMGLPNANTHSIYSATKELVKAMGFKNISDFAPDPKFNEAILNFINIISQTGIQNQDPQIAQLMQYIYTSIIPLPETKQVSSEAGAEQPQFNEPAQAFNPMNPPNTMGGGYYG